MDKNGRTGQRVDSKPSFTHGTCSEIIVKPVGETVSVSTKSLSFECNTGIMSVPRQIWFRSENWTR